MQDLKHQIEITCRIAEWNPTSLQVREIIKRISDLEKTSDSITLADLQYIVNDIVGNIVFHLLEGVDNSDLKALLVLATRASGK